LRCHEPRYAAAFSDALTLLMPRFYLFMPRLRHDKITDITLPLPYHADAYFTPMMLTCAPLNAADMPPLLP